MNVTLIGKLRKYFGSNKKKWYEKLGDSFSNQWGVTPNVICH